MPLSCFLKVPGHGAKWISLEFQSQRATPEKARSLAAPNRIWRKPSPAILMAEQKYVE